MRGQECLRRHLTSTAWSSYLGLAAVVIWAAVTLALVGSAAIQGQLQPMGWAPDWALFGSSTLEYAAQVFAVVPILATAYTCQMTVMFVVRSRPANAACANFLTCTWCMGLGLPLQCQHGMLQALAPGLVPDRRARAAGGGPGALQRAAHGARQPLGGRPLHRAVPDRRDRLVRRSPPLSILRFLSALRCTTCT